MNLLSSKSSSPPDVKDTIEFLVNYIMLEMFTKAGTLVLGTFPLIRLVFSLCKTRKFAEFQGTKPVC